MYTVDRKIFYDYVQANKLTARAGMWFHSIDYTDSEGNIKASSYTSSYGAPSHYEIDDDGFANMETLNLISNHL